MIKFIRQEGSNAQCCFVDIYAKNAKFGYLNPILGKLGVTHDRSWSPVGKPWSTFYLPCLNYFRCLLRFRSYKAKCVQLGCFRRGSLCTHILPGQGRPPSTILGVRKLEILGYPTAKTASLCVPSFWMTQYRSVTDRRTNRQTDRGSRGTDLPYSIYSACTASFFVKCKKRLLVLCVCHRR